MTRDESLQIVAMILNHWRPKIGREWTKDEISAYASSIQDMSAELTTSAVAAAAKQIAYPPSITELREYVRLERLKRAPLAAPVEPERKEMPLWVRRWICARLLYAQFNRPRDMRRFPEQGDFGDITQEQMPENEWLEEANSITDKELQTAFQRMTRS